MSYTLWLEDSIFSADTLPRMCSKWPALHLIHLVFHILQIKLATPNCFPSCQPLPPEPIEIDGEVEYEICEVLSSKYNL